MEALGDTPVVAVNGPRQAGKSTLVSTLLEIPDLEFVTLDDRIQRAAALADPEAFVEERQGPLAIDEVQRAPDLLLAIKATVDRDRRPGRFVLTGSTRLLSTPRLSESLAGRVEIVDLWPLSQGELARRPERFVDRLLAWDPALRSPGQLRRADYFDLVCGGGLPEALRRAGRRRSAWLSGYATTVIDRLTVEVAEIERASAMPTLLRLCAARTATELNVSSMAAELGIPHRTLGTYLAHLRTVFLVDLLPAWSRNLTSKVVHRPKLVMVDSGLAAHLLGVGPGALSGLPPETNPAAPGQLLESFVVMEIRKQLGWSEADASLHHFRNRDGAEVDLVLETRDGRVAGIEVKAARGVTSRDFRGLRLLEGKLGDAFAGGVVLYTGREAVPFGHKLAALPVSSLWA
ncbi:MAG: ATP-binding protein [Acidimicrobiales bacterium]